LDDSDIQLEKKKNKNSVSLWVQNGQICTKYRTDAFGDRALPGPAGELTALLQTQ